MKSIRSLLLVTFLFVDTISIYGQLAERTEEVASVKKKPAIISRDKYKYGGMIYRREIYENGISVVLDEHDNWYNFKTEYQVNEFTGEKTDNPFPLESYVGSQYRRTSIPILKGYKNIGEYDVMIDGKLRGYKYKPLGISYWFEDKKNYTISTWFWYNEHSINDIRTNAKKCVAVIGPNDERLNDFRNLKFKDVAGEIITGGYYDEKTNFMYYGASINPEFPFGYDGHMVKLYSPSGDVNKALIDHINNMKIMQLKIDSLTNISKGISEKFSRTSVMNTKRLNELRGESEEINNEINNLKERAVFVDNVTAIYCIPSDEIVKVTENENTSEVQYKNGDYVKVSKLKRKSNSGLIYECLIHRPNGIWKVNSNNNNLMCEYVFTSGDLKGFIYRGNLSLVKYLSDINLFGPNQIGGLEVFDTARNRTVHLTKDGKVKEYLDEARQAKNAAQDAEKARKAKAAYQVLCNKYGKANVDELFNNYNIKVGMPFSMIKELCHCKIDIEGDGGYKWYDVVCSGCYFDKDKNVFIPNVISVFVPTKLFWIRVEDGKVTFVGHH